nr:zinc finger protein 808-like isoform X2 [Onthophagus taurus]
METKLCRICGKLTDNHSDIFKTEGLKVKLETCLPIVISKYSLLPDTICKTCVENVESFYDFIKNCLQSIIILETQFDIHDSCLKSKRKSEKGISVGLTNSIDVSIQTEPESLASEQFSQISQTIQAAERTLDDNKIQNESKNLVNYEISDDSNPAYSSPSHNNLDFLHSFLINKQYFDNHENKLVNEITEKLNGKRKCDEIQPYRAKIFKYDVNNRRKSRVPKRIEVQSFEESYSSGWNERNGEHEITDKDAFLVKLPQICLLCEQQFENASLLATHVFDTHGIDMAQVIGGETTVERKKKLPDLVKIADLKNFEYEESQQSENHLCSICSLAFPNQQDLYAHIQSLHAKDSSSLICGLCSNIFNSHANLASHIEICRTKHSIETRYICTVCSFNDDNIKTIENHIAGHESLLEYCKKNRKIFDPNDYVEINNYFNNSIKTYVCGECNEDGKMGNFDSFKEFSAHRRCQHQIFHCDLCNKFYGRNSHLWKHVNRLHKGHPSVTCLLCNKTSASKYHLSQHFNKIHSAKNYGKNFNKIEVNSSDSNDFLKKKFEGFDFQSVKQSFLKQELLEQQQLLVMSDDDEENEIIDDDLPKEVDISSNLYTNIITNYTPPKNEGEYKCSKCFRGFLRKNVLKKHKKNCRPKNQKDLLTRCKTCTRIFKDRQSLAKHLINYHTDYDCEICQQKFQSKCEIVSHIRFSHPKCKLYCYCGSILRNSSELNTHKKDHRNSFICHFCGDNLPTKIKLKMHILSLHRKILSLSCGICLKLFETQHILRDHVRLAHKERLKPLTSCTVCGKNYGSKWKTFDHLNKSHGRIFRPCRICLEVFNNESELQNHYDFIHSESKNKSTGKNENDNENNEEIDLISDKKIIEIDQNDANKKEIEDDDEEDVKMSLLEKRLTSGKKTVSNKNKNDKKDEEIAKSYGVEEGFQNTSKRTVYVNSDVPSRCEICLKTWPAKKHLWQHYIRCHKSVAATVCGICLKANDSYTTLQHHLRENHPTLLHGQGFGSNFICRICGRYHNASSKLKLHMAIHENFDWKILEQFENKDENDEEEEENKIEKELSEEEEEEEEKSEINYENLIEEVECSSESEDEDSDSSSDDSDDEDDEIDDNDEIDEEISEENSLESQMLQNMLQEKGMLEVNVYNKEKNDKDVKIEVSSESDSSNSSYKVENVIKSDVSSLNGEDYQDIKMNYRLLSDDDEIDDSRTEIKTEQELNSAIQSICYDDDDEDDEEEHEVVIDHDYSELPMHSLNNHEIQTAVDSIL